MYPAPGGVNATVWLEQVGLGITDYRYLKTVKERLEAAKKAGAKDPEIAEAERFLAEVDKAASLERDVNEWSKALASPADFTALRDRAAELIGKLPK